MGVSDREKWDARYRSQGSTGCQSARGPASFLTSLDKTLPASGRALDIAGGAGRNAVWLARRGLDVTLVDISPAGVALAEQAAEVAGVTLKTVTIDLDAAPPPAGPWDLIISFHFLWPPLFDLAPELLAPGGLLVYEQPTRKNLERNSIPSEKFLLEEGTLVQRLRGLEILHYEEGWFEEGRHEAQCVARSPVQSKS